MNVLDYLVLAAGAALVIGSVVAVWRVLAELRRRERAAAEPDELDGHTLRYRRDLRDRQRRET